MIVFDMLYDMIEYAFQEIRMKFRRQTKGEIQRDLNIARHEIDALNVQLANVKAGAARDLNAYKAAESSWREQMKWKQEALDRAVKQRDANDQRATTFAMQNVVANRTIGQQKREIENLRRGRSFTALLRPDVVLEQESRLRKEAEQRVETLKRSHEEVTRAHNEVVRQRDEARAETGRLTIIVNTLRADRNHLIELEKIRSPVTYIMGGPVAGRASLASTQAALTKSLRETDEFRLKFESERRAASLARAQLASLKGEMRRMLGDDPA